MTQRPTTPDSVHVITNVEPIRKPLVRPRVKKLVLLLIAADVAVYGVGFLVVRVMSS